MKVVLGGLELDVFEKPSFVQMGGKQIIAKREFPGGDVSYQNMGPAYRPISWTGTFTGPSAYDRMMKVGLMRTAGKPVALVTGKVSIMVLIEEFLPDYRTDFHIPFSITLLRVVTEKKTAKAPDKVTAAAQKTKAAKTGALASTSKKNERQYVVRSGDTLTKIARAMYNDPSRWEDIYKRNQSTLKKGPHILNIGQKLIIP